MRSDSVMRCEEARLALSERLDGEGTAAKAVDAHLEGCHLCRAWLDGAELVTRTVRQEPVAVPDLTSRILAAAQSDDSGVLGTRGRARGSFGPQRPRRLGLRATLGGLAVVQLLLSVPGLLGAAGEHAHVGREVAAFDIALAVGLLVAACYPEHARAFAPVIMTLVICLALASTLDLLQGLLSPAGTAVHLMAVAQAGILWWLSRTRPRRPAIP